jgi:hypothetical protein
MLVSLESLLVFPEAAAAALVLQGVLSWGLVCELLV